MIFKYLKIVIPEKSFSLLPSNQLIFLVCVDDIYIEQ